VGIERTKEQRGEEREIRERERRKEIESPLARFPQICL
jgi:hypothetical protein